MEATSFHPPVEGCNSCTMLSSTSFSRLRLPVADEMFEDCSLSGNCYYGDEVLDAALDRVTSGYSGSLSYPPFMRVTKLVA